MPDRGHYCFDLSPWSKGIPILRINQPQAASMMVAPVAVRAQFCAEIISPATAEVTLTKSAHQNMLPADRAKFRAAAAGTISIAVTNSTPTAHTEKITTSESNPAKVYW